jgi:hypothetical protein
MNSNAIRQAMRSPHVSFFKSSSSKMPTDAFLDHSVHVFYNSEGLCEAVEFYGDVEVTLNLQPLLRVPYSVIWKYLASLDPQLDEDAAGFTSYGVGIGVYAPDRVEHPNEAVESVIVFEKGYYKN